MRNLVSTKKHHSTFDDTNHRHFSSLDRISTMAWSDAQGLLSSLMSPSLPIIIITALIALAIPIILHFTIYLSSSAAHLPTILLIGPRGSGKTYLLTLVRTPTPFLDTQSRIHPSIPS